MSGYEEASLPWRKFLGCAVQVDNKTTFNNLQVENEVFFKHLLFAWMSLSLVSVVAVAE